MTLEESRVVMCSFIIFGSVQIKTNKGQLVSFMFNGGHSLVGKGIMNFFSFELESLHESTECILLIKRKMQK
jgi:hypothetical protein